jgi:predicted PurR-regulated permease PerM
MVRARVIEYVFFFGILGGSVYVLWQIVEPFFGALAIATVVAMVGYPFYRKVLSCTPRRNRGVAAAIATLLIVTLVVVPLAALGYLIFIQAASLYTTLNADGGAALDRSIAHIETLVRYVIPSFTLEASFYAREAAGWLAEHSGDIFAATTSTIFSVGIAVISVFYFFRDGERCVAYLIDASPLPEAENTRILKALARGVRSVVLGTLAVAIIQGLLTAFGFWLFGMPTPVLWGAVAAVGSLIPGVGTLSVFVPTLLYLTLQGSYGTALGLAIWGTLAVGTIDNFLGPYLMSRGASLHPLLVLLTVLGGIAIFGPTGFILGPVTLILVAVLLELHKARSSADAQT